MKNDLDLVKIAEEEFTLNGGIHNAAHGISHWNRVKELGRYLAKHTGADTKVTDYFAYFHDLKRQNEDYDPQHGLRAAMLVKSLYEQGWNELSQVQLGQLVYACTFHSHPNAKSEDVTIKTCWDSDRLDLWRVGIKPDPFLLNTAKAKEPEVIEFAKKLYENWSKK